MDKQLQTILYSTGITRRYIGYDYFLEAIQLVAENPERIRNIGLEIYGPIAHAFNTTPANVEKNLRTIRDVFVRNHGSEILEQLTGCRFWHDNIPYPRELIEIFAIYLNASHEGLILDESHSFTI